MTSSQNTTFLLKRYGQLSFIKPSNYEAKKTRSFQKKIGRIENIAYDAEEDCFACAEGRKLSLRRECTELQHGQFVTTAWYRCEDCSGCPQRNVCCQAKDAEKPKEVTLRRTFWEMRENGRLKTHLSEIRMA